MGLKSEKTRSSLRNVQVGDAIPDSAISRWTYSEGSGSTVGDSIGSADGTYNGTWVSGTYVDGYAGDGDGADDETITGTLGTFGGDMDTDHAIAFTIETTSTDFVMGVWNSTEAQLAVTLENGVGAVNDVINYRVTDDDGNTDRINGSTTITNGTKHRVVINKIGSDPLNWGININASADSVTNDTNQGASNFSNFSEAFAHFSANGENYGNHILDDIIIANDSWTSSQIQGDYSRQPWS